MFCVYEILHLCMYDNNGISLHLLGFPGDSDSKEPTCNTGDPGSIFGLGKHPGEENGNPFQYSCLKNSMDRGACELQSVGSQSRTRLKGLSTCTHQTNRNLIVILLLFSC